MWARNIGLPFSILIDEQKKAAEESLNERQKTIGNRKIVTEITKASDFWKAEEYHQKYFEKHGVDH